MATVTVSTLTIKVFESMKSVDDLNYVFRYLLSQSAPVYPLRQLHLRVLPFSTQVALFLHGNSWHASLSVTHT